MQANVTILSSTSISFAVGVERQRVDWTKVSFDAAELFLEHQMVEASVELANTGRRRRDIHGILSTSENHL